MSGTTSDEIPTTPLKSETKSSKQDPRFTGPLQPHVGKEHGQSSGNQVGPGECKFSTTL